MTLDESYVEDCEATNGAGGGIFTQSNGTLTLTDCAIEDNVSSIDAGGIGCSECDLEIVDCCFEGNECTDGRGGGLATFESDRSIEDTEFVSNVADDGGGAIWDVDGGSTVTRTNVTHISNSLPQISTVP